MSKSKKKSKKKNVLEKEINNTKPEKNGNISEGFKLLPLSFRASHKDKTMIYFDVLPQKLKLDINVHPSTLAKSLIFTFMRMKPASQVKYLTNKKLYPGSLPNSIK